MNEVGEEKPKYKVQGDQSGIERTSKAAEEDGFEIGQGGEGRHLCRGWAKPDSIKTARTTKQSTLRLENWRVDQVQVSKVVNHFLQSINKGVASYLQDTRHKLV